MGPIISPEDERSDRSRLAPPQPVGADPFRLGVEQIGTTLYLRFAGEFDAAHVRRVEAEIDRIAEGQTTCVVFDLQGVSFLDSAALRAILGANERARFVPFDVVVVRPRGFANRVFALTGVGEQLKLVDQISQTSSREPSHLRSA